MLTHCSFGLFMFHCRHLHNVQSFRVPCFTECCRSRSLGFLRTVSLICPTGFAEAQMHVKSWHGFISTCVRYSSRAYQVGICSWRSCIHRLGLLVLAWRAFRLVTSLSWGLVRLVMKLFFLAFRDSNRHGMAKRFCAKVQKAVNDLLNNN